MKRSHMLLLAIALLIGAIVFGVIGFVHWHEAFDATEITEYGMIPFYVSSFGYGTAYNDEKDKNTDTLPVQYVEYRSEDGRFSFMREVSKEEYFDLEMARENKAEHRPVSRYVYTYMQNGELHEIIQEQELSDNQLREIIGDTNRISTAQYAIFAGILLLGGVSMLTLGLKGKKKHKPKEAANTPQRETAAGPQTTAAPKRKRPQR